MNVDTTVPDIFQHTPVKGAAYHPVFKGMASVLMMALVFYAWRFMETGAAQIGSEFKTVFALAGLMVLLSYYALLRSVTTVDGQGIRQSWMFNKTVTWDELAGARVIRLPAAMRLLVRTQTGRFVIFHAGTTALADAFIAIARRYSR